MALSFAQYNWDDEPSLREKGYFVVVFAVILYAVLQILFFPAHKGIKTMNIELKNADMQIATLEKFIEIDKKIAPQKSQTGKSGLQNHLEDILNTSIKDPKSVIADVVREITSMGHLGSIVMENISVQSVVTRAGYATVPVVFRLSGTFTSLQKYLGMLEKLQYLFTIDNVSVKLSDKHSGMVTADLRASIYLPVSVAPGGKN